VNRERKISKREKKKAGGRENRKKFSNRTGNRNEKIWRKK